MRTVDLNRAASAVRQVVYAAPWRTAGTHVLEIQVLATAHHPEVDVDAIAIAP